MEQMKVQTTAIDAKKQKAAPPSEPTAMKKQKAAPPSESEQMHMVEEYMEEQMNRVEETLDLVFYLKQKMDLMVSDMKQKMVDQMDLIVSDMKQKMAEQMEMILINTKHKMAAPSEPEPEPPFKDADFPILYLQVAVSSSPKTQTCTWHSLDLNLGKVALMDFESDLLVRSKALSFKSEIFILGGRRPPNYPQEYQGCRVLRFDTAKPSYNRRFTFSTSVPNNPPTVRICNCAALSDKFYFFLKRFDREEEYGQPALEVYDPSSNEWHSCTEAELKLPNQLKRVDPVAPVLSDSLNNRLLVYYPTEGLYAFSPDTFKWKLLHQRKHRSWYSEFQYSAVINGVLYRCNMSGDIRGAMSAFDLEDNLQPLTMVWPDQQDRDYYRFYYDIQWKSLIDLGNGRVCLLNQVTEDVNPAYRRKRCFYSYNDPEYINSSAYEHDAAIPHITKRGESKFMVVLSGMILEIEKKSGSKGNMELWVNKAIRVRYEFDHFPLSEDVSTMVYNIVPVARP